MVHIWWCISSTFEQDWIEELLTLGVVSHMITYMTPVMIMDPCRTLPNHPTLLIFNHGIDYEAICDRFAASGVPFGVIHLSDERLTSSMRYIDHKECRFAFRNYWHPILSHHHKVHTFGLGYKSGFTSVAPPSDKVYAWSFAGSLHHQRRAQSIVALKNIQPHTTHFTSFFNAPDGLDIQAYRTMISSSMFVPCPIGHQNIDSFRLYEVLEAGAIPIAVSSTEFQPFDTSNGGSYWSNMFGAKVPFPLIDEKTKGSEGWGAIILLIQNMWCNREAYSALQNEVRTFWRDAKQRWANELKSCIESMMG